MGEHALLHVRQYTDTGWATVTETISKEVPLDILWGELGVAMQRCRLWAYPHNLAELALGHVLLDCSGKEDWLYGRKATVTILASGLEALQTFQVVLEKPFTPALAPPPPIWKAEALLQAMDSFIAADGLWNSTGCFHRAGVYGVAEEQLLYRAEDIGRHNCIDRIAGWASLTETTLHDKVLLVSARLTSSICAKALRAGFRFLVSRSAVTTAAIDFARKENATLVGFARTAEKRFTVFTDPVCRLV